MELHILGLFIRCVISYNITQIYGITQRKGFHVEFHTWSNPTCHYMDVELLKTLHYKKDFMSYFM